MAKFIYTNSAINAVTLVDGKKSTDVVFIQGEEYDLPKENKYIRTLVKKGHLIPANKKSNS